MTTKEHLIEMQTTNLFKEIDEMMDKLDRDLDELLYHQGREDYGEGLPPIVQDLAYLQGMASAEDEDRNPTPAKPDEHLPV